MGTDDGPEIANLHLHQQEYQYLNGLKKVNIYKARKLNNSFRYIDDITSFNADDRILDNALTIYGNKVTLNKENVGMLQANVLDLTITINPNTQAASTTLFDKRRTFPFEVVNFPDLSASISTRMALGIIQSQIKRYYNSCTVYTSFKENCIILITTLLKQNYKIHNIVTKLQKSITRDISDKYNMPPVSIIQDIVSDTPSDSIVAGRP